MTYFCPYCNKVLKAKQQPCPHCQKKLIWPTNPEPKKD